MAYGKKQSTERYETDGDTGEVKSITKVWAKEKQDSLGNTTDLIVGKEGETEHDHTYNLDNGRTGKEDRVKW